MGIWGWSLVGGLVTAVAVAMVGALWALSELAPGVLRSLLFFCLAGAGLAAVLLALLIFFSIGRTIDRL